MEHFIFKTPFFFSCKSCNRENNPSVTKSGFLLAYLIICFLPRGENIKTKRIITYAWY